MMTLVSVCMITYNHQEFIQEAIEGVLCQVTDFNVELIVVDDCSTDDTYKEMANAMQENKGGVNLKIFQQDNNIGIIPNFFSALNKCNGEYIALCDGDDFWIDEHKLQKQFDFLNDNPDYSICYHNVDVLVNGKREDDVYTDNTQQTTTIDDLVKGNYIHTPSVMLKKNWSELPDWMLWCGTGDFPLLMFSAQFGKIKKLNEVMAVYRVHNTNNWRNLNYEHRTYKRALSLASMIGNFSSEINNVLRRDFLKISEFALEQAINNRDVNSFKIILGKKLSLEPERVMFMFNNKNIKIKSMFSKIVKRIVS